MELKRKTKIVGTLGPASATPEILDELIRSGLNLVRLNYSHGTAKGHASYISLVRDASRRTGIPVGILLDLPGPRIRTGCLSTPTVTLESGRGFVLSASKAPGNDNIVSVNWPGLPDNVRSGNTIFLDNGTIQLKVIAIEGKDIKCEIIVGGTLGWDKGINVPLASLQIPFFTEKDREGLLFGIAQDVDFLALSFVREESDIRLVKEILKTKNANIPVIAKIEKWEAWENLKSILNVSNGLMVARGDLGVELPLEKIPVIQKNIIKEANNNGKPVITATQMLESMINAPFPTRAEVTDIANSIFDGTDAIMLSGETAIGRYPVQAVQMMNRVALETEKALPYSTMLHDKGTDLKPQTEESISFAAARIAHDLGAVAIIAFTFSGSTARLVAKYRPGVTILAATPNSQEKQHLLLSWGVYPYDVPQPDSTDDIFIHATQLSRETGIAQPGDIIVITAGIPIGVSGSTNMIKVERIK
jgi:pyruvate kinase